MTDVANRPTLRPLTPAERRAERLAQILDVPVTTAGFLFLLIVVVDTATPADSTQGRVLSLASWALWLLFVMEFLARLVMARSTLAFLRRNWWQVIFLALPFLRFLRTFSRTARLARLGSSSLRSSRSATAALGSRVALLAAWTCTLVLAAATALFEFGDVRPIGRALEASTLAAVAGEPIDGLEGWTRGIAVLLVIWSAVGFATLAGAVGAFLIRRQEECDPRSAGEAPGYSITMASTPNQPVPPDDTTDRSQNPGHPAEGNPAVSAGEALTGRGPRPDGVLGPRVEVGDEDQESGGS